MDPRNKKKLLWWPIIIGDQDNPEDDTVIGFSIAKEGYGGLTSNQCHPSPTEHEMSTREMLAITGGAYSLKMEEEKTQLTVSRPGRYPRTYTIHKKKGQDENSSS